MGFQASMVQRNSTTVLFKGPSHMFIHLRIFLKNQGKTKGGKAKIGHASPMRPFTPQAPSHMLPKDEETRTPQTKAMD